MSDAKAERQTIIEGYSFQFRPDECGKQFWSPIGIRFKPCFGAWFHPCFGTRLRPRSRIGT